jgi:hypothetical protein
VEWYKKRWGIEVFHRTLKSGCRIENRQLEEADRLETCLALDMVVAWRIYYMSMMGRDKPDQPCTIFFKPVEWQALHCWIHQTPIVPSQPPTIEQAVKMIASKGGYLGRKGDGFPGTTTIWRGLVKFYAFVEAYALLTNQTYFNPFQSGP